MQMHEAWFSAFRDDFGPTSYGNGGHLAINFRVSSGVDLPFYAPFLAPHLLPGLHRALPCIHRRLSRDPREAPSHLRHPYATSHRGRFADRYAFAHAHCFGSRYESFGVSASMIAF